MLMPLEGRLGKGLSVLPLHLHKNQHSLLIVSCRKHVVASSHAQRWGVTLTREEANLSPMFFLTHAGREDSEVIWLLHKEDEATQRLRAEFYRYTVYHSEPEPAEQQ